MISNIKNKNMLNIVLTSFFVITGFNAMDFSKDSKYEIGSTRASTPDITISENKPTIEALKKLGLFKDTKLKNSTAVQAELEKIYSPETSKAIIKFVKLYETCNTFKRKNQPIFYIDKLEELNKENQTGEELIGLFNFILTTRNAYIYRGLLKLIIRGYLKPRFEDSFARCVSLLEEGLFKKTDQNLQTNRINLIKPDLPKEIAGLFEINATIKVQGIYYKLISGNLLFINTPEAIEYLYSNGFITDKGFMQIFKNLEQMKQNEEEALESLRGIYNSLKAAKDQEIAAQDQEVDSGMEAETQEQWQQGYQTEDEFEQAPKTASTAASSSDQMPSTQTVEQTDVRFEMLKKQLIEQIRINNGRTKQNLRIHLRLTRYLQARPKIYLSPAELQDAMRQAEEFNSIPEKLLAFNIIFLLKDSQQYFSLIDLMQKGFFDVKSKKEQRFLEAFKNLNEQFIRTKQVDQSLLQNIVKLFTFDQEPEEYLIFMYNLMAKGIDEARQITDHRKNQLKEQVGVVILGILKGQQKTS